MEITCKDRERLRHKAEACAKILNSEDMRQRRERWNKSNRLLERSVPFVIEDNGSFFKDLTPPQECEGELARQFEAQLLHVLSNYELIPDDRVFPPFFQIEWIISRPELCPELKVTRVPDATGRVLGYETNTPLADLESGLSKLRRDEFKVDREGTLRKVEEAKAAFGDLLPVGIVNSHVTGAAAGMSYKAVTWMGMDNFYMAMLDQPENVHRLFGFIAREAEDFLNWMIRENLVRPNGAEFWCGSGSIAYSDELPRRPVDDKGPWLPEDCWGFTEAQEAVGISGEMFAEFIFPYMERLAKRYGLVYYGCCEPVHGLWESIKRLKNLRKATISPWCDQRIMAELAGKNCVLSRKPHPMQLCGETFAPDSFSSHIKETLDIAKDNFVELIFRDTCTLNGSMKGRVAEACGIVKRLIGR
ncbi:MAG: hypothetical protein A2X49_10565 [Lentisphaerae bacterium GWF2_52_8]|nr:MAG: hypothetical protein A2X49_10565 [Lentisphaerae bacterium GWF2_52_8]